MDLAPTIKATRMSSLPKDAKYLSSFSDTSIMDRSNGLYYQVYTTTSIFVHLLNDHIGCDFSFGFEQVLQFNLDVCCHFSSSGLTLMGLRG